MKIDLSQPINMALFFFIQIRKEVGFEAHSSLMLGPNTYI